MRPTTRWLLRAGVLAVSAFPAAAAAQGAASKSLRVIVAFPAGGGADILMRIVGPAVSERTGRNLVIENRPGASGLIGAQTVAAAAPDCQTVTLATSSNFSVIPSMMSRPPYDPLRDFSPIAMIATAPLMLAVHPSLPVRSVKALVALAKAKPRELLFATNGAGSISHLATELFQDAAKIEMTHVPYKGGTPAATDTMAGHVSLIITAIPTLSAHVQAGRLRGLGVTGAGSSRLFPELPPIAASGLPGYSAIQWYGLLGPRGVTQECIAGLNRHFSDALSAPDVSERFLKGGSEPAPMTAAEFAAFIRADVTKWAGVIRAKNIKLD
ncbi:MAG: tripartite tricarboxylate transporter substrate binding protein [Burkholderiales bacterium]|nr:tripartite tricarboxylate transporter substrate binding protein [Burkholderiales bacterium]